MSPRNQLASRIADTEKKPLKSPSVAQAAATTLEEPSKGLPGALAAQEEGIQVSLEGKDSPSEEAVPVDLEVPPPGTCRPLPNPPEKLYHGTTIPAAIQILKTGVLLEGCYWGKPNEPHGPRLTTSKEVADEFATFTWCGANWPGGVALELDGPAIAKAHNLVEYWDSTSNGDHFGEEREVAVLTPELKLGPEVLRGLHLIPIPEAELRQFAEDVVQLEREESGSEELFFTSTEDVLEGYRRIQELAFPKAPSQGEPITFPGVKAAENPLFLQPGEMIGHHDYIHALNKTYTIEQPLRLERYSTRPQRPVDVPLGAWMFRSMTWDAKPGASDALRQLRMVDLSTLNIEPCLEERQDDDDQAEIALYTEWFHQGLQAPPISVNEAMAGQENAEITSGYKTVLAAKAAGLKELPAWVQPCLNGTDQHLTMGNAREMFEVPPSHNPRLNTPEFRTWFGNSKAASHTGEPIVMYRGFRRTPKADAFRTTNGRATYSFTPDPSSASVYAADPVSETYKKGCNVAPFYLSVQNPFDLRCCGEHGELSAAVDNMNYDFGVEWGEGDVVGYGDLAAALETMDETAYKSNAEFDIKASKPGEIFCISDFDELADAIREIGEKGGENAGDDIYNMLMSVEIDYYALADNEDFVMMLQDKGFDGMVHMDPVNPAFLRVREKHGHDNEALEDANEGDTKVIETWRPFGNGDISPIQQVKSLFNQGTWNPMSRSVLE